MFLDFFKGYKPLSKTFRPQNVEPYPLVKSVTSESVAVTTLQDYHQALIQFGSQGYALLKGNFTEPLIKASKANKIDRGAYTKTLILDIDGLHLDCDLIGKWDSARVTEVAEQVISLFPNEFQRTNYIACASSSCGLKNNVRLHIHYILDDLYDPMQIKNVLKSLNLAIPAIKKDLTLTSTGKALKFVIDPCLADNSRSVFIASPTFIDVDDPFDVEAERYSITTDKPVNYLNMRNIIDNLPTPEALDKAVVTTLKDIHRRRGSVFTAAKTKVRIDGAKHTRVITNPDKNTMRYAYCNDMYAYYNIGGGDSNAYYVPLTQPDVVYNFKDEDNFLFKEIDETAYNTHVERFKDLIKEAVKMRGTVIPKIFMDGDTFSCVLYNPMTEEIEDVIEVKKQKSAENLCSGYGGDIPDVIELGTKSFNPKAGMPFIKNELTLITQINTFRPNSYMKQDLIYPVDIHYDVKPNADGEQRLPAPIFNSCCPTIMKIVRHMLGDDDESVNHFINWFAFIWQFRQKPETTWLAQGTQGTGKGLFFRRIIKPLFGKYAQERMLNNIEDSFNGWVEEVLFLMLDEVNINASRDKGLKETLKNWISETDITIRGMRQEQRSVKSHFGCMMLSNEHGAVTIEAGDRRYNVAPRQEMKIDSKYPELNNDRDGFDKHCDEELEYFVMLLDSMIVNKAAVRRCLENQAKLEVSEAAMSIAERFCNAIKNGDLDYISQVMFISETNTESAIRLTKAKGIVSRFIGDANKGAVQVKQEDLRHVFASFEQRDISPNRFGRMCTKFGIAQTRLRKGMFVTVEWVLTEEDLNTLLSIMPASAAAKIPNITAPKGH